MTDGESYRPSQNQVAKLGVALVRGPIVSTMSALNNEATPTIAYAYIAAYLKNQGYDPIIIDAIGAGLNEMWSLEAYPGYQCQGLSYEQIISRIPAETEVIGISAMFSGEWPVARDLIKLIRKAFPNSVIVAGGEHTTALTEYSLRDCAELDFCVRGEGERVFADLLDCIAEGGDPTKVAGIGYLDEFGNYHENGGLPRIREIDDIPWPEWPEGYLDAFWRHGKSYGPQTERDMPMMLSRGCPYQCTFCSNPDMWTTRYILRDVDDVLAEVESYVDKHQITAVQLYDLTAITKKRWTTEFLSKIIERGIDVKWALPSGTRSEVLDYETLSMLKQVGCNYLVFAPESGSASMLERLNKRLDLPKITQSMRAAKKLGLIVRANIIIGFPGETRWDLYKTLFYGMRLSALGVDEVQPNLYSPYPGSLLFKQLFAAGQITLGDAYFLSLTSLNSDLTIFKPLTFNEFMGSRELAIYRLIFTAMNYGLGYLLHPARIIRTWRNFFKDGDAATVFEHRLKDKLRRNQAAES
jgi:anaerobic magnesium-protoporphyrin IX monomethyl ester cyclase